MAILEHDPLVGEYEHRKDFPREAEALHMLRKIASLVKPIMRRRGWKVGKLVEFYPEQHNLLGLNTNHGQIICIRLRYPGDRNQFMPLDQVTDTMLHELAHNVFGPHDQKFQKLWNELRDEHQNLVSKGYSGEGFLSDGRRLGGRRLPMSEMRRQARVAAERRRTLQSGSGQRLGGATVQRGADMRAVIANAAMGRMNITQGCASGTKEAGPLAEQASRNGFRTKALENEANERAIAQALWELVQEDENRKAGVTSNTWSTEGLKWSPENGLELADPSSGNNVGSNDFSETDWSTGGLKWSSEKGLEPSEPPSDDEVIMVSSRKIDPPSTSRSQDDRELDRQPPKRKGESLDASILPRTQQQRSSSSVSSTPEAASLQTKSTQERTWTCSICTLKNPLNFLCCDACGVERSSDDGPAATGPGSIPPPSKPKRLGWNCEGCGTFMETQWWTCSLCGRLKPSS